MKKLLLCWLLLISALASGATVFQQPPSAAGGLLVSAWYPPDGTDADYYVWDDFTLPSAAAITEIRWVGGGGAVTGFTIKIYPSNITGFEPLVDNPDVGTHNYLVKYDIAGNANESPAGLFGGVAMNNYRYALPVAFQAAANVKYWIQIEAGQNTYPPGWGYAVGTGGNNRNFQFSVGAARYSARTGDAAFTLLTSDAPSATITATANPPEGGTITGAGSYPIGSPASLTATANAGYGFVNWTENGTVVKTTATYSFTTTVDRTLVANFAQTVTVNALAWPELGGTVAGAGPYLAGDVVHMVATPKPGYVFANWEDGGLVAADTPDYTFTVTADTYLQANFVLPPQTVLFDFDSGTPVVWATNSMPSAMEKDGLTAYLAADAGAFSIQSDASTQWHLPEFGGNWLYPNVFNCRLRMSFSQPASAMTFTFATADFHYPEAPTMMELIAYNGDTTGVPVGSATARGTFGSTTMPMGWLTYNSPAPFTTVIIRIAAVQPYIPASDFVLDNFIVTTVDPIVLPTPTPIPMVEESWVIY